MRSASRVIRGARGYRSHEGAPIMTTTTRTPVSWLAKHGL